MDPVSLSFDYTLDDWRAMQIAVRRRLNHLGTPMQRIASRVPGVLLLVLLIAGATWFGNSRAGMAGILCAVGTLLLVAVQGTLVVRRLRPRPNGIFLGPARVTVDAEGLHLARAGMEGLVRWSRVLGVDASATHVFVWVDAAQCHALPARALQAPLTAAELAQRIRAFMTAAGVAPDPALESEDVVRIWSSGTGDTVSDPDHARPGVWRELAAVGRLLLVRPLDGAAIAGRDLSIFVLAVILLVLWIPIDPLIFPDDLEFNWYAVLSIGWVAAGVLALAWMLSRLARPQVPYRRMLLLVTGAIPIAILASTVNALVDDLWVYVILGVTLMWSLLYFTRGMRAVSGEHQMRALVVATVATACFVIAGDYLYVNPSFWQYVEDDEQTEDESPVADARTWQRMEELQFGQQAKLDEELARIAALPRAKSALYFVGFAGYGEQRVFAEEIALARQQVAARYGSEDRSISLVNDQRDLETLPLASSPALRYTLDNLGSMMSPDDVLFLALSSHGSEDGSISISNAGRTPVDLGATELADMLREAKIPWKVIVVSACYAGGFIDALRDDHTIVLTAAAQDRTSFGCADDRDLTYFGEAFYRDSFPKAANLRAAFEAARGTIAKREKEEQVEPSEPQAYFGALLEKKLAALGSAAAK